MILSINQPAYLPWLGYFERIAASDRHVVLDHVQFEKNSFVNRNRVRTADGACWLTVPVKSAGRFGDMPINSVRIDNTTNWRARHWRTLEQNYRKAPCFADHAGFFEEVYRREWTHLLPLCDAVTEYVLGALRIDTPLVRSSTLPVQGRKDELVLDICRHCGTDTYLSGALGRDYLRPGPFAEAGIELVYQDYAHPRYSQCRGDEFLSGMSVVDLLFNCGTDSREILLAGWPVSKGAV